MGRKNRTNPISPWRWVYAPQSGREKGGRLELTSPGGKVAATVFLHRNPGEKYCHVWFVWDQNGTGGENSAEPTVDLAVVAAEAAVRRWGKFALPSSPPPPPTLKVFDGDGR